MLVYNLVNQLFAKKKKASKIPFINNLKKPACAVKQEVLELATLRYLNMKLKLKLRSMNLDKIVQKRHFPKIINL